MLEATNRVIYRKPFRLSTPWRTSAFIPELSRAIVLDNVVLQFSMKHNSKEYETSTTNWRRTNFRGRGRQCSHHHPSCWDYSKSFECIDKQSRGAQSQPVVSAIPPFKRLHTLFHAKEASHQFPASDAASRFGDVLCSHFVCNA